MADAGASTQTSSNLSTGRLTAALFFMAFGYAVLSVGLFRILAFSASTTAFFVLYLGAGMPLGACLAQWARRRDIAMLRGSILALWGALLLVPLAGLLATRGASPLLAEPNVFLLNQFDVGFFWRRLAYQFLVACPFFVIWGFAEFVGYDMAMKSGSRPLRMGFYILFVGALLCAVLVEFLAVPFWGWARTIALAGFASVIAYEALAGPTSMRHRVASLAVATMVLVAAGGAERRFLELIVSDFMSWSGGGGEAGGTRPTMLASVWGRYVHVSLLGEPSGKGAIRGAYDGVMHWQIDNLTTGYDPVQVVFDTAPEGSDIAVLGSGGGRQVKLALNRKPRSVVAVDVIPEVFDLLKDDRYAWANGNVYQSPLVETVAADGRNYLQDSGRQFDLIVLPNTESFAAVVRSLFEPGQRIHTVEAFDVMRRHLKPNGILAIVKTLDTNERLFNRYAAGLRAVGLNTVGWIHPTKGFPGQPLVLLASPTRSALAVNAEATAFFNRDGFQFVDFQVTPPDDVPISDESPWILGVIGSFVPAEKLRAMFLGIVMVAVLGAAVLLGVSGRRHRGSSLARHAAFVAAGVGVGVHAVYLQNGVVFWFLYHLFNPLAAFFFGTAVFLLMWGLSSTLMRNWAALVAVSVLGIAGLVLSGGWQSNLSLASMVCLSLGSGFCFPLLGLRFQTRLLDLFVADAIGGFTGGILGVWLPLSFGLQYFFEMLPWVSVATLLVVVIAVRTMKPEAVSVPASYRFADES